MPTDTLSQFRNSNTIFDLEIEKLKKGKKEVTDLQYYCIWLIGFLIVSCLALQNGLYGAGQGTALIGVIVLAVLYCAGDFALSVIVSIFSGSRSSKFLSYFSGIGLFLLSLTAGVSFMLSQQHAKDVAVSRVGEIQRQISINSELFAQYHKTKTADRIERLQRELAQERGRVGADYSSSNAVNVYLSRLVGWSYESTSLAIRSFWILVFILTAMCLSALRALLWSPAKEAAACKALEKRVARQNQRLLKERGLLRQRDMIFKTGQSRSKPPKASPSVSKAVNSSYCKRTRPPYSEVLELVKNRQLLPKQRELTQLGMGADEASKYLRRMKKGGVVRPKNNRGDLELVSYSMV